MKYIVYCTTCTVNGKIYIGVHKTENPDIFDGYIGNGIEIGWNIKNPKTAYQYALKKYGYSKFKRSTLYTFDTEEEAYNKEAEIVTIDFIKRRDNYNTAVGGKHSGEHYKYIYQYDLNGNFIQEWFSVQDTAKVFHCYKNRFNIAIKEKRSAFNSFWTNQKLDKLDISDYKLSQHSEIYQYNTEGELIKIFDSVKDIQSEFPDLTKNSICCAKYNKTPLKGFYFVNADVNILNVIKQRELIHNLTDKSVSKYKNGFRVYTYPSLAQAAKENNTSSNIIKKSIKNNEGIWSYGFSDKYIYSPSTIGIKVDQYDLEGNYIKTWDSISQCRKEFPKVREVLKGERTHCKNYTFKLS